MATRQALHVELWSPKTEGVAVCERRTIARKRTDEQQFASTYSDFRIKGLPSAFQFATASRLPPAGSRGPS
jgi:hypothetical protein